MLSWIKCICAPRNPNMLYTFVQFIAREILEAWFIENILEAWLTLNPCCNWEMHKMLQLGNAQNDTESFRAVFSEWLPWRLATSVTISVLLLLLSSLRYQTNQQGLQFFCTHLKMPKMRRKTDYMGGSRTDSMYTWQLTEVRAYLRGHRFCKQW